MTCIVGLVDNDRVIIGGDTAGTNGWLGQTIRADVKVFHNGPYVMGFTTSFRMGQVLRYHADLRQPDTWDIDKYMATTFVDECRRVLKEAGWMTINSGNEVGGTFLVGYRDRLYTVMSDWQVAQAVDGYDAVGCGDTLALGALFATKDSDQGPEDRVRLALDAASHHSAGVAPPYTILTTEAPHA